MDNKGGAWMRKRMMSGSVKGTWGEATNDLCIVHQIQETLCCITVM